MKEELQIEIIKLINRLMDDPVGRQLHSKEIAMLFALLEKYCDVTYSYGGSTEINPILGVKSTTPKKGRL